MTSTSKESELNTKEINIATKWSLITEVSSKLISPITNMVLARLLTPEAFGIVATVIMITSFADIFSTAGLSKYIVQHKFKSIAEKFRTANLAFTINIFISIIFFILIVVFRDNLAIFTGSIGYGNAIAVGATTLPLTAFSSVQTAILQKEFNFKKLFCGRLVGILTPLIITIPLAMITRSFWSMIIGTLCTAFFNALILTILSEWKPRIWFSFGKAKEIMRFCIWTFGEQLLGWANLNIGIFIVSSILNSYYLGLYKTSMGVSNQIMAIFILTLSPIVLASLSKAKENREQFNTQYFYFQRMIAMILIPLGVGIFIFRESFTLIILGSQWTEASLLMGTWGLANAMASSIGSFSIETVIAKGRPSIGVIFQFINCIISIPVLFYFANIGFNELCISKASMQLVSLLMQLLFIYKVTSISFINMLNNLKDIIMATVIMALVAVILRIIYSSFEADLIYILICMCVYFAMLFIKRDNRTMIVNMMRDFGIKKACLKNNDAI